MSNQGQMQAILHSDMNSYYVSVELLSRPHLRGKPVVVAGSESDRHGIVLAKSPQAVSTGITTGMALWEARMRCPDLVVLEPNYSKYSYYSKCAREIYRVYTDLVETLGLDECWLDLGVMSPRAAWEQAEHLRVRILRELGLAVSIGVSYTKSYAKLGSDLAPRAGKYLLPPENARTVLEPLPVRALLGVGPATERKLLQSNICTLGTVQRLPQSWFHSLLGKNGDTLWLRACGIDREPVRRETEIPKQKSLERGITCRRDLFEREAVRGVLLWLAKKVEEGLYASNQKAKGVRLGWRRGDTLKWYSESLRFSVPTRFAQTFLEVGLHLYDRVQSTGVLPIRSLSLAAEPLLEEAEDRQLHLFHDPEAERKKRLQETLRQIRERFGEEAIDFARSHTDVGLPANRPKVSPLSRMMEQE